jgi:signal transduction histidine kinase
MRLRPRSVTLLAAALAGGLTDAVLLVPSLHFAYRSVRLHSMLETAAALIALLTTFLLWGRLRQRRGLPDLLLFIGLSLLSLTNLLFAAVPAVIWAEPHSFSTWTTLVAGAFGAALLAAAALAPERRLRNFTGAVQFAVFAGVAVIVAVGVTVGSLVDRLPVGVDPARSPPRSHSFVLGNGAIVVTQMLIGVLFAIAAVGFTRRAERHGDELLLWLGAGSAVAAFARVNYFLFPSLYSEWVYTGDALRLSFYTLLFVGAAREIGVYQRAHAEARVLEERRRIARDLHDGLAQELAFIATRARELELNGNRTVQLTQLASAAERGLDESRRAIAQLNLQTEDPFDVALIQTVEDVAQRLGSRVSVEADTAPGLAPYRQEQLLRIVREAMTNAVRHGEANHVRVRFSNGRVLRLRVDDDGNGFDPVAVHARGFGLVVMSERARAIGGQLRIASSPSEGTRIEVTVP